MVGGVELENLRRDQYPYLGSSACSPRVDGRAIANWPFKRHRIPPVARDTSTPSQLALSMRSILPLILRSSTNRSTLMSIFLSSVPNAFAITPICTELNGVT